MLMRSTFRVALFRQTFRRSSSSSSAAAGASDALVAQQETWGQKALRWLDTTGLLTQFVSRRAYIMHMDPNVRRNMIMVSEFEVQCRIPIGQIIHNSYGAIMFRSALV